MFHSYEEEAQRQLDKRNAERYCKLRQAMGMNLPKTWDRVEQLAAIACYVGNDDFDINLDHTDFVALSKEV